MFLGVVILFVIAPVTAIGGSDSVDVTSNIVIFGNNQSAYHKPSGSDYSTLGGFSAIRRNGSIDTFYDPFVWYLRGYSNTQWVAVTQYAAIAKGGCLITGFSAGSVDPKKEVPAVKYTCNPSPGVQFVAVSPYMFGKNGASGWPVLYKDTAGETHIGMEGLMGSISPSKGQYPIGTGWIMIASSYDHALALRNDGTVAGWGSPAYGSWNLPGGIMYSDIAVGRYFSLGLSTNGTIYAAGYDQDRQVSGRPAGSGYLSIVAYNGTAAALSHDGHILVWGESIPGVQSTVDGGYTDIALGPDYMLAIKEPAHELHLTGPISPGKPLSCRESNRYTTNELYLPEGSTIEHTINDVTRIIRPDGTEIGWVNDAEAEIVTTPWGDQVLSTNVLMVLNATYLNSTSENIVTLKKIPSDRIDETQKNILTIFYQKPVKQDTPTDKRSTGSTYCPVSAHNWVEWATMSTSSVANFWSFNTNWVIPNKPSSTEVGSVRADATKRTTVSSWNGLEKHGGGAILQAVPAWNWYYTGSSDTYLNFDKAWSWAIWGEDSTHSLAVLTTPASLNEGDSFAATYWVDSSTDSQTTWKVNAGASGSLTTISWTTSDLKKDNADMEVAEEAYLLRGKNSAASTVWDAKYFPKNTKFTNFVIQDTSGATVSPSFTGCLNREWGQNISTLKTEIVSNPYAITLHTTS